MKVNTEYFKNLEADACILPRRNRFATVRVSENLDVIVYLISGGLILVNKDQTLGIIAMINPYADTEIILKVVEKYFEGLPVTLTN